METEDVNESKSQSTSLSAVYGHMTNEALYRLAADPEQLTPAAQDTLQAEMLSRQLDPAANPFAGKDVIEFSPLVTLRHFDNALEAEMAQSLLQAYSIPASIAGNEALPFGASMPIEGEIRLQVSPANLAAAAEILAAPPADASEEGTPV